MRVWSAFSTSLAPRLAPRIVPHYEFVIEARPLALSRLRYRVEMAVDGHVVRLGTGMTHWQAHRLAKRLRSLLYVAGYHYFEVEVELDGPLKHVVM